MVRAAAAIGLLLPTACTTMRAGPMLAEPYDRPPSLLGCAGYEPVPRTDPGVRVGRVDVLVDRDGGVLNARPVGSGDVAAWAAELAADCTFEPAVRDGVAVAAWTRHEFTFRGEWR